MWRFRELAIAISSFGYLVLGDASERIEVYEPPCMYMLHQYNLQGSYY